MAIKTNKQYSVALQASISKELMFEEPLKPNTFQIRNYGANAVYVSQSSNISKYLYDIIIPSDGTRVLVVPGTQVLYLYFLTDAIGSIVVNAMYSDEIYSVDLDQTQSSIIQTFQSLPEMKITDGTHIANINADGSIDVTVKNANITVNVSNEVEVKNDTANPIPVIDNTHYTAKKVTLAALGNEDITIVPGYIMAITTALTDLIIKDGSTEVWNGNYSAGYSFYCSIKINISSVTGGIVYIVYREG